MIKIGIFHYFPFVFKLCDRNILYGHHFSYVGQLKDFLQKTFLLGGLFWIIQIILRLFFKPTRLANLLINNFFNNIVGNVFS